MIRSFLAITFFLIIASIVWFADRQDGQFIFTWIRSIPGGDKAGHLLLIGGLAFVANYGFNCRTLKLVGRPFLLGSFIVFVLSTLEETSQVFVKTRTFDLIDLSFDYLGIWLFGKLARYACRSTTDQKPTSK